MTSLFIIPALYVGLGFVLLVVLGMLFIAGLIRAVGRPRPCKITQESTGLFIGRRECVTHGVHWDDDREDCPTTWEPEPTPAPEMDSYEMVGLESTEALMRRIDSELFNKAWAEMDAPARRATGLKPCGHAPSFLCACTITTGPAPRVIREINAPDGETTIIRSWGAPAEPDESFDRVADGVWVQR